MRRLMGLGRSNRDQGATLILVALSMTAILGVGALVVDVGALAQENRALQNGADAAALAIANDCAKNACGTVTATAASYGGLNAGDGTAAVDTVCGNGGGLAACSPVPAGVTNNYVKVQLSTSSGGTNSLHFKFGPAIGRSGATVRRSAVVAWGKIGSITTLPIAIADCAFSAVAAGGLPSASIVVYLKGGAEGKTAASQNCGTGPTTYPGGFNWLATAPANCQVTATVGSQVPGDPGNNGSPGCITSLQDKPILVPMYSAVTGTGSNGSYTVSGFAEFVLQGYRIVSASWESASLISPRLTANGKCPPYPSGGNANGATCLIGKFVRFSTNLGDLTNGGTDYGVTTTKLIS